MAASEARVIELENKLNEMMKKLERIEEGTSKMSKHIEFIEGVYETVSAPMFWICNKVNRLRGEIKDTTPPTLENENENVNENVNENENEQNKENNVLEQD
ncbi:MAG: hypothetical protein CMB31_01480 [Euryarchaeota archaeon]|nr:hypothetical protein [Euryarchaeota archaeon]